MSTKEKQSPKLFEKDEVLISCVPSFRYDISLYTKAEYGIGKSLLHIKMGERLRKNRLLVDLCS